MADIRLVDVSIRDGNQSLWGAMGLPTGQILEIAPVIERVGFHAIDFTSSTHMSVAVRYHKEDPWERIRLMAAAMPATPLQFITTGMRFIAWETASADFMQLAYRTLVKNGMRRFIMLDPMHDREALLSSARMMRQAGAQDIMAALTYTISAVHDDAFYADLAGALAPSPDVDRFYIKDPAGILTPERARTLITAVQARIGAKPLEIHSHATVGLSQFNYLVAAELGVPILHTAVGPLANGSSLPSATRMVANLREHGHSVDIDDGALARMSDYFARLTQAEGWPAGMPQDYDASFMRHQIAGGVMSTTRRQLTELKLEHRMPAVIAEVERVRAELGYPIMVTPFPQIVCTQALFNVIGTARYDNVPDQVIRYVMGRFGHPTAPVDKQVEAKILDRPRARELGSEPPPPSVGELRKKLGRHLSDEELLLRAVMPAEQVDAMMAAGPARRRYNPDARLIARALGEAKETSVDAPIVIERQGLRLSLKRRAEAKAHTHA
jgi:oxaloacetate decarboxylase alpha subunit